MPEDRISTMMDMEDEIFEQGLDIEYEDMMIKEKIKEAIHDEY